jgi:hypothetical protein
MDRGTSPTNPRPQAAKRASGNALAFILARIFNVPEKARTICPWAQEEGDQANQSTILLAKKLQSATV